MAGEVTMLYIDGVAMPCPTKYEPTFSDLDSDDTSRNENGILIRNRIRQGVLKIGVGYIVSGATVATILSAIKPAKVSVRYINPETYSYQTADMYVSDRSCAMRRCLPGDELSETYWEVSFDLVQY